MRGKADVTRMLRTHMPSTRGLGGVALAAAMAVGLPLMPGCSALPKGQKQSDSILEIFSPTTPAEAARWAADPYDADKRQRGTVLLANAPFGGEQVYIELYLIRVTDDDPAVRVVAIRALALHGDWSCAPLIANRLQTDPDDNVRREAARALQRLHNPAVLEALVTSVDSKKEPDAETRAYAARALGQYAEPRVVQALIGALADRRLAVNENALESLKILTGENFGYMPKAWLAWTSKTADVFAHKGVYVYPVFQRDRTFVEYILPFWNPPNELPNQQPAGMPAPDAKPQVSAPATPAASLAEQGG